MEQEVPSLTRGAARALIEEVSSEVSSESAIVVVQVIRIDEVTSVGVDRITRYRLVLSDGENFVQGVAATQLNHLVESRQLAENDVIQVSDYMASLVANRIVIVLLDVDVMDSQRGQRIGNPTELDASFVGAAVEGTGRGQDGAGAGVTPGSLVRAPKRPAEEMSGGGGTVDASDDSSLRKLGGTIYDDFLCPISRDLLIDPVTAEDGFQYEREDIQNYIEHVRSSGDLTLRSPKTNLPMGSKLTDAIVLKNAIRRIVESGAFGDDVVGWYQLHSLVANLKKRARVKDVNAMRLLATWYKTGAHGLEVCPAQAQHWKDRATECDLERRALRDDDTEAMCVLGKAFGSGALGLRKDARLAFRWYSMAADRMDRHGMAYAGNAIVEGDGAVQDEAKGVTLIAAAAAMRSDCGCFFFGKYHLEGHHRPCLDSTQARFWLERAIDINGKGGGFLDEEQIRKATEMLRNIQT